MQVQGKIDCLEVLGGCQSAGWWSRGAHGPVGAKAGSSGEKSHGAAPMVAMQPP